MGNVGTKAFRFSSHKRTIDKVSKVGNASKNSVELESRVDADLAKKGAEILELGNQGKRGDKVGHGLGAETEESTVPELPDGPGLQDLFNMIESHTHVFAQDAERARAVPSKQVSEEMKKNRIESKELRRLMEHVSSIDLESSNLDIGALAAQFGIPEDSLLQVIRYYSLPSIRRTVDGRLVAHDLCRAADRDQSIENMAEEFEQARNAVYKNAQHPRPSAVVDYLDKIRNASLPRVSEVYELGSLLLSRHATSLKQSDLWNVKEDVAIACMLLGKEEEALNLIQDILGKFKTSRRVSCLQGMYGERIGNFDEAKKIYEASLESCSQSFELLHRVVALKQSRGDIPGALDMLHKHLETHMTDSRAWIQAGKLHIKQGSYSKAVFCLEEALMHQTGDIALQLVIADALYAEGGHHSIRQARKYFSGVLEVSKGSNMRALLGVCSCTARLKAMGHPCNDTLGQTAAQVVLQEYAAENRDMVPIVKEFLKTQRYAL
eukprot:jgi/Picsp_1/5231/NSC_02594-R1_o-linked c transferase-like protein